MTIYPVGYTILMTDDPPRQRPLLIDLWYPAMAGVTEHSHDYGLGQGSVAEDAEPEGDRRPLIVMSHGAMGAARNYSWIAEYLARQGLIVAGISHYGESYVYGPGTIDPAAAAAPWLRPLDCSTAIDFLIGHSSFGRLIDPSRIGAMGHSSGGATVIALGGARFDPVAMQWYCQSKLAEADKGCGYGRASLQPPPRPEEAGLSYRDMRIRAIAAMDPALGPGYPAATLAGITVPVLIVGAVQNDFLPFHAHAGHYAGSIPGARLVRLDQGEGHFIYLDVCPDTRDAGGVPLCRDRPGVDRAGVHEHLRRIIAGFFGQHLS